MLVEYDPMVFPYFILAKYFGMLGIMENVDAWFKFIYKFIMTLYFRCNQVCLV